MTAQKKSPAAAKKSEGGTVRIKWVVSFIGCPRDMRQTIRGLGFRRMQQIVERPDNAATRGMILKVRHLVQVQEDAHENARHDARERAHEKHAKAPESNTGRE
jgi:large subunit ribosomal protein L30